MDSQRRLGMPEEIINALQYPASMADTDLPTTTVKSNFAESTIITSSTIGCALAILAAGFAVQLAHGFYQAKALLALVAAIVFCALAIAGPQVTVILPFRRRAVVSRIFVISLVASRCY